MIAVSGLFVMIKAAFHLVRRSDLSREQFLTYWLEKHVKLAQSLPEARYVRRYVQQHIIHDLPPGFPKSKWDGIAEAWFEDFDDMIMALSSKNFVEVVGKDEENFLDRSQTEIIFSVEKQNVWTII